MANHEANVDDIGSANRRLMTEQHIREADTRYIAYLERERLQDASDARQWRKLIQRQFETAEWVSDQCEGDVKVVDAALGGDEFVPGILRFGSRRWELVSTAYRLIEE